MFVTLVKCYIYLSKQFMVPINRSQNLLCYIYIYAFFLSLCWCVNFFQVPIVDDNSTAPVAPVLPPVVHVHTSDLSPKHGLKHHKLTTLHDPHLSGLVSAESAESAEVVPVAPAVVVDAPLVSVDPAVPVADLAVDPSPAAADPAPTAADPAPAVADPVPAADSVSTSDASQSAEVPVVLMKRDVSDVPAPIVVDTPTAQIDPISLVPVCPGRIRFF